ncbi:hypothetical protein BES34_009800 [Leptospira inadai serovar Lyme]|uniref:Uncharacterized protein n=1 Tax=Leptospira inadai serovar Lyme TaxID=293084 RepID=A0ABX4YIS6_9LEPT|nr:hypothetical protein BES34_009800 [Leptospira inadai serovar Lyme]
MTRNEVKGAANLLEQELIHGFINRNLKRCSGVPISFVMVCLIRYFPYRLRFRKILSESKEQIRGVRVVVSKQFSTSDGPGM